MKMKKNISDDDFVFFFLFFVRSLFILFVVFCVLPFSIIFFYSWLSEFFSIVQFLMLFFIRLFFCVLSFSSSFAKWILLAKKKDKWIHTVIERYINNNILWALLWNNLKWRLQCFWSSFVYSLRFDNVYICLRRLNTEQRCVR